MQRIDTVAGDPSTLSETSAASSAVQIRDANFPNLYRSPSKAPQARIPAIQAGEPADVLNYKSEQGIAMAKAVVQRGERDFAIMSLVGVAHYMSHVLQLALPPLFPILHREFGV